MILLVLSASIILLHVMWILYWVAHRRLLHLPILDRNNSIFNLLLFWIHYSIFIWCIVLLIVRNTFILSHYFQLSDWFPLIFIIYHFLKVLYFVYLAILWNAIVAVLALICILSHPSVCRTIRVLLRTANTVIILFSAHCPCLSELLLWVSWSSISWINWHLNIAKFLHGTLHPQLLDIIDWLPLANLSIGWCQFINYHCFLLMCRYVLLVLMKLVHLFLSL